MFLAMAITIFKCILSLCMILHFVDGKTKFSFKYFIITPPNFRVCARQIVPAKRFKICYILYTQKPKVAFPVFHFVLLYIFF